MDASSFGEDTQGTAAWPVLDVVLEGLGRLDRRLTEAAERAGEIFGPNAVADPYRGLYVAREDIERLLGSTPVAPRFPGAEPLRAGLWTDLVTGSPRLGGILGRFGLSEFDL